MKILVIVRHVLFLRFVGPIIEELLHSGHSVEVAHTLDIADDYTKNIQEFSWFRDVSIQPAPIEKGLIYRGLLFLRLCQDYVRYLDPIYDAAPKLRNRAAIPIPGSIRMIFVMMGARFAPPRWLILRILRQVDQCIPCNSKVLNFLSSRTFDLLLVTPLVDPTSGECEYLKCAIRNKQKTVLLVASWDNLTNKGLVQFEPDKILVWNRWIAREAIELHRLPEKKIRVIGAPVFDQWFSMTPSSNWDAFVSRVGLATGVPIILYLCSSGFIAGNEVESIIDWLKALRSHPDEVVRSAGVLIRPHPGNPQDWSRLSDFSDVAIWPRGGEQVLDEEARSRYFDSLYHAAVIVGVNTSGMIEAGIIGRPIVMLFDERIKLTQDGTLHFRYLVENGLIEVVSSEEEHFIKLEQYLNKCDPFREARLKFIEDFVHPNGWSMPAAPIVVKELEATVYSC